MGILFSSGSGSFKRIPDRFSTIDQVQEELRRQGLESSNLIIGIDFTKSNNWTGAKTFNNQCLHTIDPTGMRQNPYQEAIRIIGETLSAFDDDKLIPCYGFGDAITTDKSVFPFFVDRPCNGLEEVLERYKVMAPLTVLAGPTSFAPLIREAIRIVQMSRSYHILVIIADGQVTNERETIESIVEASRYPLSIIMVGVGDGPWELMKEFDDRLPQRQFDNFQFVPFDTVMKKNNGRPAAFALQALMEIPQQYHAIKSLHLL